MRVKCLFIALLMTTSASAQREPHGTTAVQWWLSTPDKVHLVEKQPDMNIEAPVAGNETLNGASAASANGSDAGIIVLDPTQTFQTIDGFGFALTGGSAQLIHQLPQEARTNLLKNLFGPGPDYGSISYLRISIGSSDLNDHTFSYDDLEPGQTDTSLSHFSLQEDEKDLIPILQEILVIQPNIKILGSPWSAPIWMKTNQNIQGGVLKDKYYPVYAQYFVRYLQGMAAEGIHLDAITVQNEPFNDGNTPSMQFLAKKEEAFIRDYLGPALDASKVHTKIILYDHNCDAPEYPISILTDPEAAKYVDGSGFHLYVGQTSAMSKVHEAFPQKNLYFTEMMVVNHRAFDMAGPMNRIFIGAMRNWSRNIILWNLAADPQNKPHTDNGGCSGCQGAITIDKDSVSSNLAYYTLTQVSRFVPPGAKRIASNLPDGLPNVAFQRPDGSLVLIVVNQNAQAEKVQIRFPTGQIKVLLTTHSVATFTFPK